MDDNHSTNARDAADDAGRPLQPPKRHAAEQKREVDAALQLVHGMSGDFDDANDTDDEPVNSEDRLPELSDESAEVGTGDGADVDESAAAQDLSGDSSGSSDAFASRSWQGTVTRAPLGSNTSILAPPVISTGRKLSTSAARPRDAAEASGAAEGPIFRRH
jgi:hypothetical protein